MSKMGQLNMQLQEQAEELGFSTVQEALDAGYEADYNHGGLISPSAQLYERAKQDFDDFKHAKMADEMHDYDYYSLAIMYEITEFFRQLDDDEAKKLINLGTPPLDAMYNRWMKYDDTLWSEFRIVMNDLTEGE